MKEQPEIEQPELISIIDGPPPEFMFGGENLAPEVYDTTAPYEVARCDMRTMSGPKMLARCRNAWDERKPVLLEFRDMDGLKKRLEICGARYEEIGNEGTLLQLWVRLPVEMQFVSVVDEDDDDE